ncbi:MAG: TetR/AcrR family transcriptional regulator [Actinomycetota bacterium]|nr:TetR/AcrR family transcriptional regulator [Actinomycetota bacterium]
MATRRLSAEARRAQLLDVARAVFAADGYPGAAMEQIASSAGVTKPVLYQHFESKKELYLALLEEDMSRLLADVEKTIQGVTSNRDRIHGGIEAYFTFIDENEGSFRLLFRETMGADPDFREAIDRFRDALANRIGAIIAAETRLPKSESELLARGVMGIAESAAQWWLERREVDKEKVVRDLSDLAWRGLAGLPRHHNSGGQA